MKRSTMHRCEPGIQQVAAMAGLSAHTVAQVLRGADVSPAARTRVMQAAARLNYVPRAGSRERSGRKVIGVFADDYGPGLTHALLSGLARHAGQAGCRLLLIHDRYLDHPDKLQGEELIGACCDGVVLLRTAPAGEALGAWLAGQRRCVVLNSDRPGLDIPAIGADVGKGIGLALGHLVCLGHRRIAYLADPAGHAPGSRQRAAFAQALNQAGSAVDQALFVLGGASRTEGFDATRRLLRLDGRPSAIIAANDEMAFGALVAAKSAGLQVPRDLSLVGMGDIPEARAVMPPLTTVRAPIDAMCRKAVAELLDRIGDPGHPARQWRHAVQLVVRESTGPAPQAADCRPGAAIHTPQPLPASVAAAQEAFCSAFA